jgi:hypothetical protein
MATIHLADQEYNIPTLKYKAARAWREKAAEPLAMLSGTFAAAADFDLTRPSDLSHLLEIVGSVLVQSPDLLVDLLFEYMVNIDKKERKRIEENSTDDELLEAFVEVLKVAYPFGRVMGMLSPGQATRQTRKK